MPIWIVILLLIMVGSLTVMPLSGNTKKADGEIKAYQRLQIYSAAFNSPFIGTCQVSPSGDSVECEALAYAGDVGTFTLQISNNGNTPTIALLSITSDPHLQWALATVDGSASIVREVCSCSFAFYLPAGGCGCLHTLVLTLLVTGTDPDGIFNFSFAITPEI